MKELGAKWSYRVQSGMYRQSSCFATEQTRSFIRKNQIANWAAIRYTADHIHDYIEVDDSHAIFEVEVPGDWIGKPIGELDIRKKYSISILAIKIRRKDEYGDWS